MQTRYAKLCHYKHCKLVMNLIGPRIYRIYRDYRDVKIWND